MNESKITLTVTKGSLQGKEFVFAQPARCIVGRAADCDIQLPREYRAVDISRHHCELDINPPHIQVRDLGSRNGTFVNGQNIGQRPGDRPAEEADFRGCPVRELHNGDEVQVGAIVFEVKEKETPG